VRDTVQVAVPPGFNAVGEQFRLSNPAGGVRPRTNVREPPFRVAVRVALVWLGTAAAVTVKVAPLDPEFTRTDGGVVAAA
jgi:hypothetical protein